MELMVDLTENKNTSMLSLQGFQLLGGGVKPACRDSFTQICNLIFPLPKGARGMSGVARPTNFI